MAIVTKKVLSPFITIYYHLSPSKQGDPVPKPLTPASLTVDAISLCSISLFCQWFYIFLLSTAMCVRPFHVSSHIGPSGFTQKNGENICTIHFSHPFSQEAAKDAATKEAAAKEATKQAAEKEAAAKAAAKEAATKEAAAKEATKAATSDSDWIGKNRGVHRGVNMIS